MDILTTFFKVIFEYLPFIIFLFAIDCILIIYYKKFRGYMGEFWIKKELKKLPKNQYKIFNDFFIKDQYGTHQIDHIVISK